MDTYKINLLASLKKRWLPILNNEGTNPDRLINDSKGRVSLSILKPVIKELFDAIGGGFEYAKDIKIIAKLLKIDEGSVVCSNLEYELAMCAFADNYGGSAAALYSPELGMLHISNLDWPGKYIGKYTIKVIYESDCGKFTAITWPGFVGVVSAVAKGRFSATMNMLPLPRMLGVFPKPNLSGWPASFLLRYIFENNKTFEDALEEIKITPVVAPVLITLVGPQKGQAVVVERGTEDYKILEYKQPILVATNHNIESEEDRSEDDLLQDPKYNYTFRRKIIIEEDAKKININKLSDAFDLLKHKPVFNELTSQSIIFHIETGEVLVETYFKDSLSDKMKEWIAMSNILLNSGYTLKNIENLIDKRFMIGSKGKIEDVITHKYYRTESLKADEEEKIELAQLLLNNGYKIEQIEDFTGSFCIISDDGEVIMVDSPWSIGRVPWRRATKKVCKKKKTKKKRVIK